MTKQERADERTGSGAKPLTHETNGQANYAAYGDRVGWVNFAGARIPDWDDLGERIQQAWDAGADAVRQRVLAELEGGSAAYGLGEPQPPEA